MTKTSGISAVKAEAERRKPWPQIWDLLKWWIYHQLDKTPVEEVTPDLIGVWISNIFRTTTTHGVIHAKLWNGYEEFRQQFAKPKEHKIRTNPKEEQS